MRCAPGRWELLEGTLDFIVAGTVSSEGSVYAGSSRQWFNATAAEQRPSFTRFDRLFWGAAPYEGNKSQTYTYQSLDHQSGEVIARLIHLGATDRNANSETLIKGVKR